MHGLGLYFALIQSVGHEPVRRRAPDPVEPLDEATLDAWAAWAAADPVRSGEHIGSFPVADPVGPIITTPTPTRTPAPMPPRI